MHAFIKGALRAASVRWGPKHAAKAAARVSFGKYRCAGYGQQKTHVVPASLPPKPGRKRRRQIAVDHIKPVVDPKVGFTTWDELIERMFCEVDGYQILCPDCHEEKTADERAIRTAARRSQ
jgi:hypothetical protein